MSTRWHKRSSLLSFKDYHSSSMNTQNQLLKSLAYGLMREISLFGCLGKLQSQGGFHLLALNCPNLLKHLLLQGRGVGT